MAQIIFDYSANTHKNDRDTISEMISAIQGIDTGKHEIIFKAQLFEKAGDNIVCDKTIFTYMYVKCLEAGYKCTASVFDKRSLDFLLNFDVPFVKIANNPDLHWLVGEIPRKYHVYQSVPVHEYLPIPCSTVLHFVQLGCVSEYPAKIEGYPKRIVRISDHTIGLELFHRNKPFVWEKHLKMPDSTGLDSGPFAITPQELRDIL